MKHFPKIAIIVGITLAINSAPANAASSGQACNKAGAKTVSVSKGKKTSLVCTKVGKALKWKSPGATTTATAPAPASLTIVDEVSATDSTLHSISVNGSAKRSYILHVPSSYSSGSAMPLMIALHGHSWTAARFRDTTQLNQIADLKNFIVAYPDGEGNMWNAGNCCSTLGTDDVTLISGMIDSITSKYNIDKSRVWVLGHSNGAMMAYRAACEIGEKITAIGVGGGTFAAYSCKPAKAVSVIQVHGTADQTISIDGTIWGPTPLLSATKYASYAGCSTTSSSTWTCTNGSQIQVNIENGVGHYSQSWWAEMTNFLIAHPRA